MKTLSRVLLTLSLLTSSAAFADRSVTALQPDDAGLSAISGTITDVRALCPDGMVCFANGTVIELSFTLNGCLDRLGPVSHRVESSDDGRLVLSVSALNIHNRRSLVAFCGEMPVEKRTLTLINRYGDVEINFLGTSVGPVSFDPSETEASLTPVVHCHENVDHGGEVTFLGNEAGEIVRAVYTETTFADSHVISEMNVCRKLQLSGPNADAPIITHTCNDTDWVGSYDVELLAPGFTGISKARLYYGPSPRELVKTLTCDRLR